MKEDDLFAKRADAAGRSCDFYLPSLPELTKQLGLRAEVWSGETVTVPTQFLKLLLTYLLERQPFDEVRYAEMYPDVANAVEQGNVGSLREHYVSTGYFEGRLPGSFPIDEDWYVSEYRDLGRALKRGALPNPSKHFNETGRLEGRVGSAAQKQAQLRWFAAMAGS